MNGHTGFKGSWLSLALNAPDEKVTGYAKKPLTGPNLFKRCSVGSKVMKTKNAYGATLRMSP
jgi:hypothetical protein